MIDTLTDDEIMEKIAVILFKHGVTAVSMDPTLRGKEFLDIFSFKCPTAEAQTSCRKDLYEALPSLFKES